MIKKFIVIAVAAAITGSASAQVLYNQDPHTPGATGGNGLSTFGGALAGVTYDRELADDFTVTGPGWVVTHVDMTGIWAVAPFQRDPTSWDVRFYTDTGTGPAATAAFSPLMVGQVGTDTGMTWFSRGGRSWVIDIDDTVLAPGTWWVSIQPQADENFFQLTSTPTTPINGSEAYLRDVNGNGYPLTWGTTTVQFGVPHDLAFSVHGTVVPEPATMAALGLGVVALLRRRRKSA